MVFGFQYWLFYFVILALSIVAGVKDSPVSIGQLSRSIPWSTWFESVMPVVIQQSITLGTELVMIVIAIVAIIVIINPPSKYGIRRSRKQALVDGFNGIKKEKTKVFGVLLCIFFSPILLYPTASLLAFVSYNKLTYSNNTWLLLPDGWWQYFGTIALIYGLTAIILTITLIMPQVPEKEAERNPLEVSTSVIYAAAWAVLLIAPIYTIGIYPNLPQQLGGGKLIRVEAVVSSDNLRPIFTDADTETYLIDRTSNSSLFLLLNKDKQKSRIMEVSSSLIQSITYALSP